MKKIVAGILVFAMLLSGVVVQARPVVADVLIDDTDAGFTKGGDWSIVSSDVAVGGEYLVSNDSNGWAMWTPQIETAGYYQIFIMTHQFSGKSGHIAVEVGSAEGVKQGHSISLYIDSGYWHSLDTYYFEPGQTAYVKTSTPFGGKMFADAVKFVYAPQHEPKPDPSNTQSLERMLSLNLAFKLGSDRAYIYGEEQQLDAEPALVNDRTYLPLRYAGEGLGGTVSWDESTQKAIIQKDGDTVEMTIGDSCIYLNGEKREIDGTIYMENDRTMVPLRAVSEAFGKNVSYQEDGLILIAEEGYQADPNLDVNTIADLSDLFEDHVQPPEDTYLIECESFDNLAGWVLDQQSMDVMGSPYIMAHGLGKKVNDAYTQFSVEKAGTYTVWARTRNWVESFGNSGSPGLFQIAVNGEPLEEEFGKSGEEWHWQKGGTVTLNQGENKLELIDLTGFNGRCDAVLFSMDDGFVPPDSGVPLAQFRAKLNPVEIEDKGSFDLVVVGGGVAGVCASVGAARMGVKVALIQDRPVLGGNSSTEVKVGISGESNFEPYPFIGSLVREYEAADKFEFVQAEENLTLFMNFHADAVDVNQDRSIRSVYATDTVTGEKIRISGTLFADCTGDGTLGYMAGADYENKTDGIMGSTNMWGIRDTGSPQPFPEIDWGFDLSGINTADNRNQDFGGWVWESGMFMDNALEVEYVRDNNLLGLFSTWNAIKNIDGRMPNHEISYCTYITGKRESRRLMGDLILQTDDIYYSTEFLDGLVPCTWPVDLHYPDPTFGQDKIETPYIAYCVQIGYSTPFWLPYRTLYSRNIPNLFMAGRDISVTHEALGATRVMRTTGMMGEIVALASKICVDHDALPREVYTDYLDELKNYAKNAWENN